jgi:hypothetical protein
MNRISYRTAIAALALVGAAPAPAQLSDLAGGAGGLLGGVLPNIGSTTAGNAAGVLSYCMKNKLLRATNANSVLGQLTGKPGVKESKGFSLGRTGTLQMEDSTLPLAGLKSKVKAKVCDLVLNHATSLL